MDTPCDLCDAPATGGDVLCDWHREKLAAGEAFRSARALIREQCPSLVLVDEKHLDLLYRAAKLVRLIDKGETPPDRIKRLVEHWSVEWGMD